MAAPRVHVEGDRIDCEGGLDPDAVSALERRGEQINRFEGLNLYFGGANAVTQSHDGRLLAAGDPRRDCFGLVLLAVSAGGSRAVLRSRRLPSPAPRRG